MNWCIASAGPSLYAADLSKATDRVSAGAAPMKKVRPERATIWRDNAAEVQVKSVAKLDLR
jgi:hypothetical protein